MARYMGSVTAGAFDGWFPIGFEWTNAGPLLNWFRLDEAGFDGSSFSDIVARCARRPFNLAFRRQTTLEQLGEIVESNASAPPSGIIFHMSRCGSTLVSRMLAALPDTRVIAEAAPVDAAIHAHLRDPAITEEQRVRWLRYVVAALARVSNASQRRFVLKVDAWHAWDIALFERAFPGVPWIFLYRNPIEVAVSHMQVASYMMSAANAPAAMDLPVTEAVRIPRETYVAQVLAGIFDAVTAHGANPEQIVNYDDLPGAAWERIAPLFGFDISEEDVRRMGRVAEYHAKHPGVPFADDREFKRSAATPALIQAIETLVNPPLQRLRGMCGNSTKDHPSNSISM